MPDLDALELDAGEVASDAGEEERIAAEMRRGWWWQRPPLDTRGAVNLFYKLCRFLFLSIDLDRLVSIRPPKLCH